VIDSGIKIKPGNNPVILFRTYISAACFNLEIGDALFQDSSITSVVYITEIKKAEITEVVSAIIFFLKIRISYLILR